MDAGSIVHIDYDLYDAGSERLIETTREDVAKEHDVFDESRTYQPMITIVGDGRLISGFENHLNDAEAGKDYEFDIEPTEGYGERDSSLVETIGQNVLMRSVRDPSTLAIGAPVEIGGRTGVLQFISAGRARIDYNHPFLAQPSDYLSESESMSYKVDEAYFNAKTYNDLTIKGVKVPTQHPDYVIIEMPNILDTNYPADLIVSSNLALLVCRSNRLWSKADENLLNNIKEIVSSSLQFIINGVELDEVEALLGELPKQRSNFRKRIKNILRFQFYTKSHI